MASSGFTPHSWAVATFCAQPLVVADVPWLEWVRESPTTAVGRMVMYHTGMRRRAMGADRPCDSRGQAFGFEARVVYVCWGGCVRASSSTDPNRKLAASTLGAVKRPSCRAQCWCRCRAHAECEHHKGVTSPHPCVEHTPYAITRWQLAACPHSSAVVARRWRRARVDHPLALAEAGSWGAGWLAGVTSELADLPSHHTSSWEPKCTRYPRGSSPLWHI